MTRELKLALIVGFVLVLLVTVLISDHFSSTRKGTPQAIDTKQPIAVVPLPEPITPVFTNPEPIVIAQGASTPAAFDPALVQPALDTGTFPMSNIRPSLLTMSQGPVVGGQVNANPLPAQNTIAFTPVSGLGAPHTTLAEQSPESASLSSSSSAGPAPIPTRIEPLLPIIEPKPIEPERWYTIAPGDTTWKIAKRYYGNGELWRKLADMNGDRINKETGSVRVGVKIKLPSAEAMGVKVKNLPTPTTVPGRDAVGKTRIADQKPSSTGRAATGRTYTIKKGDTLGQISSRELGSAKRYPEILAMNKGVLDDESTIRVGATIALPAR